MFFGPTDTDEASFLGFGFGAAAIFSTALAEGTASTTSGPCPPEITEAEDDDDDEEEEEDCERDLVPEPSDP